LRARSPRSLDFDASRDVLIHGSDELVPGFVTIANIAASAGMPFFRIGDSIVESMSLWIAVRGLRSGVARVRHVPGEDRPRVPRRSGEKIDPEALGVLSRIRIEHVAALRDFPSSIPSQFGCSCSNDLF
jgi:hypothetical protein